MFKFKSLHVNRWSRQGQRRQVAPLPLPQRRGEVAQTPSRGATEISTQDARVSELTFHVTARGVISRIPPFGDVGMGIHTTQPFRQPFSVYSLLYFHDCNAGSATSRASKAREQIKAVDFNGNWYDVRRAVVSACGLKVQR